MEFLVFERLTNQVFKEGGDMEFYENDLNAQFGTETSLKASLLYLFKPTFFALNLFGFREADNETLKTKSKHINNILESRVNHVYDCSVSHWDANFPQNEEPNRE